MKKIMFNDKYGLTKAVLEGRKTQTRRIISLNDGETVKVVSLSNGDTMSYIAQEGYPTAKCEETEMPNFKRILEPKFFIGEEVAVAQSYMDIMRYYHSLGHVDTRKVSEQELVFRNAMREFESKGNDSAMRGDENKMFVKAELMPHRIKITDIRIERLQDIKHHWTDALCEGVMLDMDAPVGEQFYIKKDGVKEFFLYVTAAFASLIDKTCGKGTWDSNPYVFVYFFELVK